jgi:hypothetical protein
MKRYFDNFLPIFLCRFLNWQSLFLDNLVSQMSTQTCKMHTNLSFKPVVWKDFLQQYFDKKFTFYRNIGHRNILCDSSLRKMHFYKAEKWARKKRSSGFFCSCHENQFVVNGRSTPLRGPAVMSWWQLNEQILWTSFSITSPGNNAIKEILYPTRQEEKKSKPVLSL